MTYYRNKRGDVVHESWCEHAKRGRPWLWAEGKSTTRISMAMYELGIRRCGCCLPPLVPRKHLRVVGD